ncbi:MAG: TetR/AcrR family transcriptional regulator [Myxococcota bacterium]
MTAAAAVFAEQGLAKASVAAILARCHVGRGTFYRCFANLEDAFMAVQHEAVRRLYAHVLSRVADCTEPEHQLAAGISAYFEALVVLGDFARVVYVERPNLEAHRDLRKASLEQFMELFRRGLVQAHSAGLIESVPDDLAIYAVVNGLEAVAMRLLENGFDPEQRARAEQTLIEVCIRALCVPVDEPPPAHS